jgi:replicative DNA helicase
MKENKLADTFVLELFKCAFKEESIFETLIKHLKYSYLTFDYEKKFWKKCLQLFYDKNYPPSLGLIQAELRKDEEVRDFIYEIKQSDDTNPKDLLIALQTYIKESMYVEVFEKSGDLYNRGEEQKAISVFQKGSEEIFNFSLHDKVYEKLFDGFNERFEERKNPDAQNEKNPFYIDKLDEDTMGGPERGETVLALAESGIGKSQFLIHYAVRTAVAGKNVLFFQVEGTKKQVMTRMDAAWSGLPYHEIKTSTIAGDEQSKRKKINSAIKKMSGEIYIEAFEKFGGVTTLGIKQSIKEAKKIYGDIALVCIDYLELCDLEDGVTYGPNMERFRQQKIAQQFKEIAMEENLTLATVTQASNLASDLKNDSSFVMTREYLAEDKGKIRAFDFFYTFNQTFDEKRNRNDNNEYASIIRIHADKIRDYASGQTHTVVTNFKRSRFYDKLRTVEYVLNSDEIED